MNIWEQYRWLQKWAREEKTLVLPLLGGFVPPDPYRMGKIRRLEHSFRTNALIAHMSDGCAYTAASLLAANGVVAPTPAQAV